jgi:hypothetical protein
VQKKHADYAEKHRDSLWSLEQVEQELVRSGCCTQPGWATDPRYPGGLQQQMKGIMTTCAMAASSKLQRRPGYFDLLGFDLLVSETLQCSLLEVNTNPALHLDDSPVLEDLLPTVVSQALEKVLEAHGMLKLSGGGGSTSGSAEKQVPVPAATAAVAVVEANAENGGAGAPGGFNLLVDEETGFEWKPSLN